MLALFALNRAIEKVRNYVVTSKDCFLNLKNRASLSSEES